jgi:hypothetical protein
MRNPQEICDELFQSLAYEKMAAGENHAASLIYARMQAEKLFTPEMVDNSELDLQAKCMAWSKLHIIGDL